MGVLSKIGSEEQVRLWDGCQSYWKLDETSGTFVADSIGGNNLTVNNGGFNANGKNNYCYYNTATSGYGMFSSGNVFNFENTDSFTMNAWINPNNVSGIKNIFTKMNPSSPYNGYVFRLNDNKLYFDLQHVYGGAGADEIDGTVNGFTFTGGNWYMVTWTYNGSSKASGCTIYINGQSYAATIDSDNLTSSIKTLNTTRFCIGGRDNANLNWIGYIDEPAIWNRVLREDEVKMLYSNGNGKFYGTQALSFKDLIHYWNFNETGGTTVYDRKGAYNGTLTSTAARTTSGKSYSGMTFTSGHYCSYGTPFTWTAAQPYSVSCWVKAPSNPTPVIPILSNLDSSTSGTIDIYFDTNNAYFGLFYNNTTGRCFCTAAGALADTNWHHFLFTYNGSSSAYGMQIYKDGVAVGTASTNTLTNTGNLGATLYTNRRYTTNYDNGAIVDEIAIFNKALTVNDAIALYNAGNGIYY